MEEKAGCKKLKLYKQVRINIAYYFISFFIVTLLLSNYAGFSDSENEYDWSRHEIIDVASGEGYALVENPQILVDSEDNIHIVWEDQRNGYSLEIYYALFNQTGKKVTNDTRLSNIALYDGLTVYDYRAYSPSMVMDSNGHIHVFWLEEIWLQEESYNSGGYHLKIRHAHINPAGEILSLTDVYDEQTYTGIFQTSASVAAAITVGIDYLDNLHIFYIAPLDVHTYERREIHYMKISPNNSILINKTTLTSYNSKGIWLPSIEVVHESVHMVWVYDIWVDNHCNSSEIYYTLIDTKDNTIEYIVNATIIEMMGFGGWHLSCGIDSDNIGNVHIVYRYAFSGNHSLRYVQLDHHGNIIVSPIDFHLGSYSDTEIEIDDMGTLHLVSNTEGNPLGPGSSLWYGKFNLTNEGPESHYYCSNISNRFAQNCIAHFNLDNNNHAHIVWSDWDSYIDEKHYTIRYSTNAYEKTVSPEIPPATQHQQDNSLLIVLVVVVITIIIIGVIVIKRHKSKD